MSKNRLDEGTVRRFMKLANLGPLSEKVVSEMGMSYARDDEALPGGEEEEMGAMGDPGEEEPMGDMDETTRHSQVVKKRKWAPWAIPVKKSLWVIWTSPVKRVASLRKMLTC